MKRIFWILAISALSFSTAFAQDDSFYQHDSSSNKNVNDNGEVVNAVKPQSFAANNDNSVYNYNHGSTPAANTQGPKLDMGKYPVDNDNSVYNDPPANTQTPKVAKVDNDNSFYDNNGDSKSYETAPAPAPAAANNAVSNSDNSAPVNSPNNQPVTPAPAPDNGTDNRLAYSNNNNNATGNNYDSPPAAPAPNNNGANNSGYSNNNPANSNYNNESAAPAQANNNYGGNSTAGKGYSNESTDPSYYNNNGANYNSQPQPDNQQYASADNSNVSYQNFYDQLRPYGTWVNYPGYGNVWVPTEVPANFSPYVTGGHWTYTNYGWTWASDYAWGWAPFHYGRWFNDNTYGWMWVPGYHWSPACVSWGNYGNYYCWAPLAPYGYFAGSYRPAYYWNFIDRAHFCEGNLGYYMANRALYGRGDYRGLYAHINVITNSHYIGNRSYFSGPGAGDVARATGRNITATSIHNVNHAMAPRFSGNTAHQQGNLSGYRSQTANNRSEMQRGQQYRAAQQHSNYASVQNRGGQNYGSAQRGYGRSQPIRSQGERTFASAQRPSSHGSYSTGHSSGYSSARSSGSGHSSGSGARSGGGHGGGRR